MSCRICGPKPVWLSAMHLLGWRVSTGFFHLFGGALTWLCGFIGHRWCDEPSHIALWHCDRWGCDMWMSDEPWQARWVVI